MRRATAVVGRDAQVDRLRRALDAARAGGATCVVLMGEAGIGKTRLLHEAAGIAEAAGAAVLAGRPPIAAPARFGVITEALRSWLRRNPRIASLAPYDRGLGLVLPEWPVEGPSDDLDASQLRLLALEGVVQLLRRITGTAGVAVVLADDLHAADPETLEAIRYIAGARLEGVALIVSLRPGEVPPSPLVADILARTDGVPLFVEELLRGHVEAGTATLGAEGAAWHGGAANVPGTVRDLVSARVDGLDERQRYILLAGAVVGDFEPVLMRVVTGASDDAIADALAAGVRAGLLEPAGASIAYRHAIVRDAVLACAVPHMVDTFHRRAAAALEGDVTPGAEAHERRARHLAAVGADDQAAAALADAARSWVRGHALLAAERAARAAHDLATRPPTRADAADALAAALAAQGRWAEALDIDEATVVQHGETPARQLRRVTCALDGGRPDLAESILAAAGEEGGPAAELVLAQGRAALVRGDGARALACVARVTADPAVDLGTRLAALELEGRAHDFLGDRESARRSWTRQARDASAAGRAQAELRAVVQIAKLELFAGEPPQRLREAVELAREAGSLVELAWAEENLAIALALQGDLPSAAAVLDDAIARSRLSKPLSTPPPAGCRSTAPSSWFSPPTSSAVRRSLDGSVKHSTSTTPRARHSRSIASARPSGPPAVPCRGAGARPGWCRQSSPAWASPGERQRSSG
ncbi:MAG: AAA family ATPase [Actinobacteria bacterium]|nr:AAA family ATPase [Actinomycetota bacterium]